MAAKSPARSASGGAPPSSPRLPSPPPLPELQLGPSSPSVNAAPGGLRLDNSAQQDDGAARRIRPGTSASEMARGPPFVPLHQLESPFQLQEYLKSSYSSVTRDDRSSTIKPITKDTAMQLATPPKQQDTGEPVDRNLWLYELCRFLVQRTNRLIVSFFADSPPCSNQTCPEMRASEWQYLCAVHEPPKSCCAIDYCCHTLDWAANILTSTKHFPSRLSLGGEGGSAYSSMRQLTNIFRRVYRIYAHAWFQHREAFWMLEQEEGLYKFFRTVCDAYALIPEDNYTIPPEAEGDRDDFVDTPVSQGRPDMDNALSRNDTQVNLNQQQPSQPSAQREPEPAPAPPSTPAQSMPNTQRRHRHTPSTGTQVTVIAEGAEEEEEDPSNENKRSQFSQAVPAEPTATSTTQVSSSSSPPKPQSRSPRLDMSIPITGTQADKMSAPEDPTPTPERHSADPFAEPGDTAAAAETATQIPAAYPYRTQGDASNDMEPPTPLTAVDKSQSLPISKIVMPTLKTQTPPPASTQDEEVRSPGGGSIRTVGGDILSGILAHTYDDDDSNAIPPKEELEAKTQATENKTIPLEPAAEVSPGKDAKDVGKSAEDDEEMGEIPLDRTTTAIHEPESQSKEDVKGEDKEKEEKEASNADGTKTEEVASGVV